MLVTCHPKRWWDQCVPEDKKKEIETFFTDEKCQIVGIVSSKINMLINYRLLNRVVA